MSAENEFREQVASNIEGLGADPYMRDLTRLWFRESLKHFYSYNFTVLSRPIIQYPQDMVAMQELIWRVKPDLIVETGIAHGGSLIMSAAMLSLIDYCDAVDADVVLDPKASKRRVLGIDIDIRAHNRAAIERHPMAHRIDLLEGSSIAEETIHKVHQASAGYQKIMVVLDSNHTHEHVLAELEAYAPLTSKDSYCVVFDTVVEDLPKSMFPDRPWGPGDNPKTAVREYLASLQSGECLARDGDRLRLEVDNTIQDKLQITVAPDGYLRRIA